LLSQLAFEPVQVERSQLVPVLVVAHHQRRHGRFVEVLHVDKIAQQLFQVDNAYQVEIRERFDALLANQERVHVGLGGHEFVMCGDLFDCAFVYHLDAICLVQALIALMLLLFELFACQRKHFAAVFTVCFEC